MLLTFTNNSNCTINSSLLPFKECLRLRLDSWVSPRQSFDHYRVPRRDHDCHVPEKWVHGQTRIFDMGRQKLHFATQVFNFKTVAIEQIKTSLSTVAFCVVSAMIHGICIWLHVSQDCQIILRESLWDRMQVKSFLCICFLVNISQRLCPLTFQSQMTFNLSALAETVQEQK
jgi:hypothetical protein